MLAPIEIFENSRNGKLVDRGFLVVEGGVEFAQCNFTGGHVAGAHGREKPVVHDLPEHVTLGQNLVLKWTQKLGVQVRPEPIALSCIIGLVQGFDLADVLLGDARMDHDLVGQHVGFNGVKGIGHDVCDQVLAQRNVVIDDAVYLELFEDVFLEGHRANKPD